MKRGRQRFIGTRCEVKAGCSLPDYRTEFKCFQAEFFLGLAAGIQLESVSPQRSSDSSIIFPGEVGKKKYELYLVNTFTGVNSVTWVSLQVFERTFISHCLVLTPISINVQRGPQTARSLRRILT